MTEQKQPTSYAIPEEDPPLGLNSVIYKFEHRGRRDLKALQREFKTETRGQFLAHLVEKYPQRLKRLGITDEEIGLMRDEGELPSGFDVRHIKPLQARDSSNRFENLVFLPKLPHGLAIHRYLSPQLTAGRVGRQREIKLPLPRGPILPVPLESVPAITELRHAEQQRQLAAEAERQRLKEIRKQEREAEQERKREEKRVRDEEKARKREIKQVEEAARLEAKRQEAAAERRERFKRIAKELDPEQLDRLVATMYDPGKQVWDQRLIALARDFDKNYDGTDSATAKRRLNDQAAILSSGPHASIAHVPMVEVDYVRRIKKYAMVEGEKVDVLRYQGLLAKREFLKMLAEDHGDTIKDVYKLTDCEIDGMKQGFSPEGLSVHHKMPLGGCGDPLVAMRANDFDNLILIPNEPYHHMIHAHLDPQIANLKLGESRRVRLPIPEGMWFDPTYRYERSGPPKCCSSETPGPYCKPPGKSGDATPAPARP